MRSNNECSQTDIHIHSRRILSGKKTIACLCAITVMFAIVNVRAEDSRLSDSETIYIYGTRSRSKDAVTTPNLTILEGKDLENAGSVSDLLRSQVGLNVTQLGVGGPSSVSIRGSESRHVLVLLDGVPLNDPSSPSRSFDVSQIALGQVERIEILRGPQSVLYGNEAMGGVISIVTRSPKSGVHTRLTAEGGSLQSFRETGAIQARRGSWSGALSVEREDRQGASLASGTEKDGVHGTDVSAKVTHSKGIIDASVFGRFHQRDVDFDGFDMATSQLVDASGEVVKQQDGLVGFRIEGTSKDDRLHGVGQFSWAKVHRRIESTTFPSTYAGESGQGTMSLEWNASERILLKGGVDGNWESAKDIPKSGRSVGGFVSPVMELLPWLRAAAGARIEHHSIFGNSWTGQTSVEWHETVPGLSVTGAVAQGSKAPSLQQLYGWGGNTNLRPEDSTEWEASVAYQRGISETRLTYFHHQYRNLIINQWIPIVTYLNGGKAQSRGLEVSQDFEWKKWSVGWGVTLNEARAEGSTRQLARRPMVEGYGRATLRPIPKVMLTFVVKAIGERYDQPSSDDLLSPFATLDISAKYRVSSTWAMTARVENMLNEKYEEARGYSSPGVLGTFGIEAEF